MVSSNLKINHERLLADFEQLSKIGLTANNGICRLALSREDLEARSWFADRIEEAGFLVHDDDAGNLSGILPCDNPKAKTLLIGSHLDTVLNAGRYDGAVGVLAAFESLRTINEAGIKLPVHLEVIDFTDDEGAWQPMFGSLSLTGRLPKNYLRDANGEMSSFRAALIRAGINPEHVHRARRAAADLAGYIEVHIEQGWRLERSRVDIGVVTGIVGRSSYQYAFHGQAGHSGTSSMWERRDALQGAAIFITRAHELVREHYPEGVINCGNVEVKPGTRTIIPSEVIVTIECRHVDEAMLSEMEQALIGLAHECAQAYRLTVTSDRFGHIATAMMSDSVIGAIEKACNQLGATHTRLASYASHNAQVMSTFTESGMLFIPSVNGISHNPAEFSRWEDVVRGTNVLMHAILNMALRQ